MTTVKMASAESASPLNRPTRSNRNHLKRPRSLEALDLSSSKPGPLPPITTPESQHDSDESQRPTINQVVLGDLIIRPLFKNLYPKKLDATLSSGRLFICRFCFKYTTVFEEMAIHRMHCEKEYTTPTGTVVFSSGRYSIYEIDGEALPLYCQNLSLFGKMFLDTKSVCYGVESFRFYILVETDADSGKYSTIGFFSKEKMSWDNFNLACILIFPPWQRRGLGKLLIAFSYELSRRNGTIGSPETPLSQDGERGYQGYWKYSLRRLLLGLDRPTITIRELSEITHIRTQDILRTLEEMNVLVTSQQKVKTLQIPRKGKRLISQSEIDKYPAVVLEDIAAGL